MKSARLPRLSLLSLGVAALCLPLAACTNAGDTQSSPAAPRKNITLNLASAQDDTTMAIAQVYANILEHMGYTIKFTDSQSAPYQQVAEGSADLAIDLAPQALDLLDDGKNLRGEDGILSIEEAANLVNRINQADLKFTAAPLSPADAGKVMVLSAAEATDYKVDSVPSFAAACQDLSIVSDKHLTVAFDQALKNAGCEKPQVQVKRTADLPQELRTATNQVVLLSAQNAMIADEGFKTIDGSSALFDAAPYLPIMSDKVDDQAAQGIKDISRQLSQEAVIGLNRLVDGPNAISPQDAAKRWALLSDN